MNNKEQENICKNCGQESIARDGHFDCSPPEEKLKSEVGGIVCQCGNPINIDRINDFWLEKLSSHNARLIERVEGKKRDIVETAINNSEILLTVDFGYNQAIDDILQIIKEEQL